MVMEYRGIKTGKLASVCLLLFSYVFSLFTNDDDLNKIIAMYGGFAFISSDSVSCMRNAKDIALLRYK